jgi:hypothetical protein
VIAAQIQEQMRSGQVFADDNLSAWFPSATEREIEAALQQVRGHAGRARKLLRLQHEDVGAPSLALGKQQSQSSSTSSLGRSSTPPRQEQERRETSPFAAETLPASSSARAAELAMQKRTRLRQEALELEKRRRQSVKATAGAHAAGTVGGGATASVAGEEERARLRREALSREKARRAALTQAESSSRASGQLSVDDMAAILLAARSSSNSSSTSTRPTTGMRSSSSSSSVEPPPPSPQRGLSSQREAERLPRSKTGTSTHLQQQASPQRRQQLRAAAENGVANGSVLPSKGAFSEAVPPPPGLGGRTFKRMPPVPKQKAARRKQPQPQTEAFEPRGSSV